MCIVPFLISLFFVVPVADDFSYVLDLRNCGGYSVKGIWELIKHQYLVWEGAFFAIGLGGALDIMPFWGYRSITVILVICLVGFLTMVYKLLSTILRKVVFSNREVLLSILIIICYLEARIPREIFSWVVGACNYTIPLIVGLAGVLFLIYAYSSPNPYFYIVLSAILGFLASGGSLQITGSVCWIYLGFLVYDILKNRRKIYMMSFFGTFSGALVNALAPGNWSRKAISYENISIFETMYYALIAVWKELKFLLFESYVLLFLMLILIYVIIFLKPQKNFLINPIFIAIFWGPNCYISVFPVCVGYASVDLSERNWNVLDFWLVLGAVFTIISIVNFGKLNFPKLSIKFSIAVSMGILVVFLVNSDFSFAMMPSTKCIQEIVSGELQSYHDEWIQAFNTIEESNNQIVEVEISELAQRKDLVIKHPGMSDNFGNWVNDAVAKYYYKEKVRVVYR